MSESSRLVAAIRASVGIAAISIIVIVAMSYGVDGDIAKAGIWGIGAIAVGAESLAAWIGGKKNAG